MHKQSLTHFLDVVLLVEELIEEGDLGEATTDGGREGRSGVP